MNDDRKFKVMVAGLGVYVVLWLAFVVAMIFVAVHFIAKWW